MNFTPFLEDLTARMEDEVEAGIRQAWINFREGRSGLGADEPFVPPSRAPKPPMVQWPEIHINDALGDIDLMIMHQLSMVSASLAAGSNGILNVRSNYGVSIMASQLGCEVYIMPRKHHNLPTPRPLPGPDPIRRAIDAGVPDLRTGQGGDVFDCGARLAELLASHEVLDRWIFLYHPDAQGPIDNAELAWGSDMFLAFYDTPELVHDYLDLATEHYITFLKTWHAEHPSRSPYSAHWGHLFKGPIMLRDDSLMNLSPEIYDEFIFPREARCLNELGGGAIHYCGRGSHVIDRFSRIECLSAANLSQPHLNDMDAVFAATIDKGIALLDLQADAARAAAGTGRDLRGRVHCARE
ncbi:MAG: hypothetical protein E4G90_03320 [Gemmatimonadales bacterium]|nr:MAG: hypothetical protein E4G90_03320 [Gemmatimonadales bacterium]